MWRNSDYANQFPHETDPDLDMPQFQDDGALWVWDPDSKTYIQTEGDEFDHDRNHSDGGDHQLFDPAKDRFRAKNPLQEGILASAYDKCDECSTELLPDGKCPRCTQIQDEFRNNPQQNIQYYPFFERVPHENTMETDEGYPSRLSYKTQDGRAITVEPAGANMNRNKFSHVLDEESYRQANQPSLDECPECSAPMMDKDGTKVCHSCGHKQPIIHIQATQRHAAPAALLAIPELLAGGAEAAGAAGAAGGEAAGAGGMMGGMGNLMKGALSPGNMLKGQGIKSLLTGGGDKGGDQSGSPQQSAPAEPPLAPVDVPDPFAHTGARPSGGDNDSDDIFSDEKDLGEDDHPENDGERDFQMEVSDNPEFLKDVDDEGGPLSGEDPFNPLKPFKNRQHQALTTFEHAMPLIMFYAGSDDAGSDNPVLSALDELMEEAFPGYKDGIEEGGESKPKSKSKSDDSDDDGDNDADDSDNDSDDDSDDVEAGEKTSNVEMDYPCPVCGQTGPCPHKPAQNSTIAPGAPMSAGGTGNPAGSAPASQRAYSHAQMEFVAARKPHMCPHHKNLVETALALGDPAAALSSLAQHQFGDHSCQGNWEGDKSCKFKPAMITQTYWDEKAQKAQERREQIQAEQELHHNDAQDEAMDMPGEYEDNLDTVLDSTPTDNVIEVDFGHSPSSDDLGSAVGGGDMQMAAKVAVVESETDEVNHADYNSDNEWKDDKGHPLKAGHDYLLKAPSYEIPDRVTVDAVKPDHISFTVHTDMMEYRDEMTRQDVNNEGYEFINSGSEEAQDMPDSTDGFDATPEDPDVESDLGEHDPTAIHARLMGGGDEEYEMPHHAARMWLLEDDEPMTHVAARDFSPTEQRRFIDEPGKARNLDRLDLKGTHYIEASEASIPDDHLFLW
jgi:hypothetical protein